MEKTEQSQDQKFEVLSNCFYCIPSRRLSKDIEIKPQTTCFYLT